MEDEGRRQAGGVKEKIVARYLKQCVKISKDWAAPVVLLGKICERQNEPDMALDCYMRAVRLGERDKEVIRRASDLLQSRGRVKEAKQLSDYLEKHK
jgi:cellulose synthase operon protein C